MSRIMVSATCCKAGEILANDVTNDKDIIIVVKNTVVNQYIKDKFMELQIPYIWLYQPENNMNDMENEIKFKAKKKTYKDVILNLKWVLNNLTAGHKLDYEKLVSIFKAFDEYTYTHCINVGFYSNY